MGWFFVVSGIVFIGFELFLVPLNLVLALFGAGLVATGFSLLGGLGMVAGLGIGIAVVALGWGVLSKRKVGAAVGLEDEDIGNTVVVRRVGEEAALRVEYRGCEWDARYVGRDVSVEVGATLKIEGKNGAELLVS